MNIAVCDDQLDYLNLIKKKLIECFQEFGIYFIHRFRSFLLFEIVKFGVKYIIFPLFMLECRKKRTGKGR